MPTREQVHELYEIARELRKLDPSIDDLTEDTVVQIIRGSNAPQDGEFYIPTDTLQDAPLAKLECQTRPLLSRAITLGAFSAPAHLRLLGIVQNSTMPLREAGCWLKVNAKEIYQAALALVKPAICELAARDILANLIVGHYGKTSNVRLAAKRKGGRPRLKAYQEQEREEVVTLWLRAKQQGKRGVGGWHMSRGEFCRSQGIELSYLQLCQDWWRQRMRRASQRTT